MNKTPFNADNAEEYFTDLLAFYKSECEKIYRQDNEGRHPSNPIYSAEYQRVYGRTEALKEVLEYFAKFEL
jgi:hypothetical protein